MRPFSLLPNAGAPGSDPENCNRRLDLPGSEAPTTNFGVERLLSTPNPSSFLRTQKLLNLVSKHNVGLGVSIVAAESLQSSPDLTPT
mmetsp:Transcript_12443/g.37956  ORF Transcript_12443/g.37956 Transcript_12443/m.37956 type:complete len:87 (+) Transcript_12443:277-537(+)|eukprot:CAMPEP_0198731674 /NCGR_PEP_ID=MMETSP1475-20131203/31405_1 /TAXON_ID= ORGANISM="Unidentified sp., Strain CCMP1999" /NCGR_SAMPLE_ID=MMETSP1475 /ASSEMBLY_ACC=CAM_ASM_001111 /LENGTH=86 /DNA_ID=CAMNT_0044494669 /DNA_START=113 /DNA_END=373 /DNA_ORIENTATION=-